MKIKSLLISQSISLISNVLSLMFIFVLSSTNISSAQTLIGGVINNYWQVISVDMCNNRVALPMIVVGVNVGDKMMLMQIHPAF